MTIDPTDLSRPGAPHVASYWAATGGPEVEGCPAVAADIDTDVAIIGGGYTGLSTAYHLARDFGIRAHLLEANRVGWGCSGRNGGFCSAGIGKEDIGGCVRRFGLEQAKATLELGRDALRTVRGLIDSENIDAEVTPEGGLELAHKPNRLPAMAARAKRMRELFGVEMQLLGKAELEHDFLASREAHGALLHGDGFALHALRFARGLARGAQARGAMLHGASPVVDWQRDGAFHLLRSPGGTVRARRVVIATNGYTGDRLNPWTAGRLLPVLSNIIVTRPLSEAERAAVNWRSYQKIWDSRRLLFYYRLLPDNRVLFGARGGVHDTPADHRYRRAWLERRFADMFPPLARVETEYFWHGWVCVSLDRNPHAGTTDDPTVHYWLACIGTGVALATQAGKILARRLGGDASAVFGPLLETPLPRFPFPALRRVYQRIAYAGYALEDEWL